MELQATNQAQAFGSYLRSERELRQIPLAEVAAVTKIPLRALQCLEDGQWDELPPHVFIRGFVRSYARCLRICEREANRRFEQVGGRDQRREAFHQPSEDLDSGERPAVGAEVGGRRRFELALLVIIVVILATITLSLLWRRGGHTDIQAGLSPTRAPVAASAADRTRA